ncbi:hypothetical protein [Acidisarcina polymorpha]|nr:hypothetical protein [Acidisarcina polymorpha]
MATDRLITSVEAREMLRRVYRSDGEINLAEVLRRGVSDPIKPIAETGRMRPSTPLVVASVVVLLLIAAFVYFSVGARR